jgi:hypothetical protein
MWQEQLALQDSPASAVSPMREMGAYEALWLRAEATFARLAARFRQDPSALPSNLVSGEEADTCASEALQWLRDHGVLRFGVRVYRAGEYPQKLRDAASPVELLYYQGWWNFVETRAEFTRIDELYRGDYHFLRPDDSCYFLREYTAGKGYAASETNSIVSNLKKSPLKRNTPEWPDKERAIKRDLGVDPTGHLRADTPFACEIRSRVRRSDDSGVEPRWAARGLRCARTAGVQSQHASAPSKRQTSQPPEIRANYEILEALCKPRPTAIGLVDDVLTAGAHFRAAKDLLAERFAGVPIVGLFYARTIRPADVTGE